MKQQQIKYFYNVDSNMIYKVVNNYFIEVWLRSKACWSRCATSVPDLLSAYYKNRYIVIDERKLASYKSRSY